MTQAPPSPTLDYAFTARVTVDPPVELGVVEGGQRRFIPITGGVVDGPLLSATILPLGGDWQTIEPGGLTRVEARYFLRTADRTTIEITNPGVRTASEAITQDLARGVPVAPDAYYFRTTPRFAVAAGPHDWLGRHVFVARGVRRPDLVLVDFYVVR
jgi:hypothetical protein